MEGGMGSVTATRQDSQDRPQSALQVLPQTRKLTKGLSRNQTSALAQLRSGHVPLNVYLHRINKASSPGCASCLQGDESVHHFLFECHTWNHERWQMEKALGREVKSAVCIMSMEKGISKLLKYVGHMGRLKATFGDVLLPL